VVPGRRCSSWSRTTRPLRSFTGTTDRSKRPSFQALAARSCDSAAYSSTSSRREALDGGDQVGADALRHEVGGEVGHRVGEPGAAVGGHRHPGHRLDAAGEDEVLPARTDLGAARLTASRPEAQKRFSWTPATVSGSPAAMAAIRAMSEPWSPTGSDDTEHDVVDRGRVEPREAAADLVDEPDDQVDGLGAVQGAVRLAAAARGRIRYTPCRARAGCGSASYAAVGEHAVRM
jgi:hypothetical protein